MAEYLRLEMRGKDWDTFCRLCLGEKDHLIHIFESEGIPGWSAANAINELLRIEVSAVDIYPKVICTECMGKLVDFKFFKHQCEVNKESLDHEYSRKCEVRDNEAVGGMVLCGSGNQDGIFLEEDFGIPVEKDPLELSEAEDSIKSEMEESSNGCSESSPAEVIGLGKQASNPMKCNYEDQFSNGHCENIAHSGSGIEEEYLEVKEESCLDVFEADMPKFPEVELTSGINYNAGLSERMRDNTSDAHSSRMKNDIRGPVRVLRSSRVEDIIGNERKDEESYPNSSHSSKQTTNSYNIPQDIELEHKSMKLGQKGSEFSLVSNTPNEGKIHPNGVGSKCIKSLERFPKADSLQSQTLIHSVENTLQLAECSKSVRKNANPESEMNIISKETPYKCTHCPKSFSLKSTLKNHLRVHLGVRPYKCVHCDKTFSRKDNHGVHMMTHSSERPFKCNQCSLSFPKKDMLKRHMVYHSAEKPFKCPHCCKTFIQKRSLRAHLITHSGEKSFKCNECSKAFYRKELLNAHMIIHSGERLYKCTHCSKSFYRNTYLKAHMISHSSKKPFECNVCGNSFYRNSCLKLHMFTHSVDKPFKCSLCSNGYYRKDALKEHLESHSGEKLFWCSVCLKTFSRKSNLQAHMLIHSGK